jgi:hypothetical protein
VARRYFAEDDALRAAVERLRHARTASTLLGGDPRKL